MTDLRSNGLRECICHRAMGEGTERLGISRGSRKVRLDREKEGDKSAIGVSLYPGSTEEEVS
jgi:hypothetical protein